MGKIFIINDDGSKREVLNIQELQELARQGAVLPETKIEAKGRVVNAGKIKELTGVFIATRIRRQNAEKAGGAAVNDAPEVNGASPDAFKALEELGSVPPADTAQPPVADFAAEGALYAGEMEIPEEFKPKPEAVKKAKQKKDDNLETFRAKYNLLDVDDKELEDAVNAKHQRAIKNIDAAIGTLQTIANFLYLGAIITGLALLLSFLKLGLGVVAAAASTFITSLILAALAGVLLRTLRFVKNHFIVNCKDSLKREIYLAELLRKNGE